MLLEDISKGIEQLTNKFQLDEHSFGLVKRRWLSVLTKPAYQASIGILLKQQSKKRLSNSAMETLAIIAYKQPITMTDIEQIRGVNCDYAVNKLLEKGLVEIKGKQIRLGSRCFMVRARTSWITLVSMI